MHSKKVFFSSTVTFISAGHRGNLGKHWAPMEVHLVWDGTLPSRLVCTGP